MHSSKSRIIIFSTLFFSSSLYADKFSESTQALVRLVDPQSPITKFIEAQLKTFGFDPATLPFRLDFSGYIKNESFLDSRQTYDFAEGQFMLMPLQFEPDVNGCDINAHGRFNMSIIETRGRLNIIGPQVYDINTRAYIECDFLGNVRVEQEIDVLSLRHAYMELEKGDYKFLAGQTYHPLVYPAEAPDTVCFSSGSPLTPFLFSPQFRFGYETEKLGLYLTLLGEIDPLTDGPQSISTIYFRNSMMPEINVHGRVNFEGPYSYSDHYIGACANVKRIVPRLSTNLNYKSVESLTNVALSGYFRTRLDKLTVYGKGIYVENGNDFVMIGGYAVSCVSPNTDRREYVNFRFASGWLEFIYDLDKFEPAIFVGGGKNLGTTRPIIQNILVSTDADVDLTSTTNYFTDNVTTNSVTEQTIYGAGNNISYVTRLSPRLRCYYWAPFLIATEIEWTRAAYGTINACGKIENAKPVNNIRWELACYYIF
jgi:hypothetical protein